MVLWQTTLYILSSAMFYSLLVVGFGFILRSSKFFNVAYGGAFLVGGYAMFLLYRMYLVPFFLAIVISLALSGLYFVLSNKFIFEPLFKRKASNFILLISSFGLLIATSAIIGIIFGNQATIVARHLSDVSTVNILGGALSYVQLATFIVTPVLIIALAIIYYKTRFGRAMRAIENDREMSELVGISTSNITMWVYMISGILAGIGGIGEGFEVGINPYAGLFYILPIIVVAVLGGMKSFWGGILGAFVLVIAQKLTVLIFGGSWEQAVPFVVLIIVLLVRPEGILKR